MLSCRGDRRVVLFRLYYPTIRIQIPAGLSGILPRVYVLDPVATQIRNFLPAGLDTALISRIEPERARLISLDEGLPFYWLREISVRICQPGAVSCQAVEEMFYQNDLAQRRPALEIDMFPTLVNARKQMVRNTFRLELWLYMQDVTPREIPARLEMEFAAYP